MVAFVGLVDFRLKFFDAFVRCLACNVSLGGHAFAPPQANSENSIRFSKHIDHLDHLYDLVFDAGVGVDSLEYPSLAIAAVSRHRAENTGRCIASHRKGAHP